MSLRKINCLNCNNECFVEAREINRGNGKYCSRSCSAIHIKSLIPKPDPNVTCAWCHVNFYKNDSKKKVSRSGIHFCCREHKDLAQRLHGGIKEIMPPHYGTGNYRNHYRELVFTILNKPKICERCNYSSHEAAIIVHHKDRNRENNNISNLEILCCNCHAIEHWSDPND